MSALERDLRSQAGDVDKDGEIVDRLRATGAEGESLDGVLRLLAAGEGLDAAAEARGRPARWRGSANERHRHQEEAARLDEAWQWAT